MQLKQIEVSALTISSSGIARVITSPIVVENTKTAVKEQTLGIWDTGATNSAITKSLALKLGLVPISETMVKGVHGVKEGVNVYGVKIVLNNQNVVFTLPVTECDQLSDDDTSEFLIGMDVISKGDFAITNFQGQTVMTYRKPSIQRMDFVTEIRSHQSVVVGKAQGRNDLCNCGSGKKYKFCHGK
ncbi:MAG: aspartyl protease family protein [Ignavibacteriaceae bacterium]|jgi:hypothetical protein|nr:aspartyl protease family protein [Ignavibacteriaceae bacterium]